MKVKFETTCNIDFIPYDLRCFIEEQLDFAFAQAIKNFPDKKFLTNINVNYAEEVPEEEKRTDIISGETCPVCGFNGEIKVVELTDEYVKCHCPQCKHYFILKLNED